MCIRALVLFIVHNCMPEAAFQSSHGLSDKMCLAKACRTLSPDELAALLTQTGCGSSQAATSALHCVSHWSRMCSQTLWRTQQARTMLLTLSISHSSAFKTLNLAFNRPKAFSTTRLALESVVERLHCGVVCTAMKERLHQVTLQQKGLVTEEDCSYWHSIDDLARYSEDTSPYYFRSYGGPVHCCVVILPWTPYIGEQELVVLFKHREQNYTLPTLIVVVILLIFFGRRNFDVATVHCAEALWKACAGFELPHVVSDIIQTEIAQFGARAHLRQRRKTPGR